MNKIDEKEVTIMHVVVGIVFITLGIYNLYKNYKTFRFTQKKGNKQTSPFLLNAFTYGLIFSLALVGAGTIALFHIV